MADRAAAHHDYRAENAALDAALQRLGAAYAPAGTIDDTGMHLVVAASQLRSGKPRLAAELKRLALLERLQLCREALRTANHR